GTAAFYGTAGAAAFYGTAGAAAGRSGCAGHMRGWCDGTSAGAWRDAPARASRLHLGPRGALGTTAMPHRRGQNHYGVTLPWLGLDTRGWQENAGARHEARTPPDGGDLGPLGQI